MFSKWCSHCSKIKKAEAKKLKREEAQRRKEQVAEEQNQIFERARQEMLVGSSSLLQLTQTNNSIEDSITVRAKELASQYLAEHKQECGIPETVLYEDTVFLYKVLLTPVSELAEKMY